jgi:hypothetical protein
MRQLRSWLSLPGRLLLARKGTYKLDESAAPSVWGEVTAQRTPNQGRVDFGPPFVVLRRACWHSFGKRQSRENSFKRFTRGGRYN